MKKLILTHLFGLMLTGACFAQISFTADTTSGCAPLTVTFTNTSTTGTTYYWYFGDGFTYSGFDTAHTYTSAGSYWATLEAYDGAGNYLGSSSTTITIGGSSGYFYSSADSACPNTTIYFSNYDNVTSWSWNFGDGATATGQYVEHAYAATGNYTVTLIVNSSCGNDTIVKNINITNTIYPDAGFGFYPNPACPGQPVNFYPYYSDNTSFWNFGDGTTSVDAYPVHAYSAVGTYTITHIATNACGNNDTVTNTITIDTTSNFNSWTTIYQNPKPACPGDNVNLSTDWGYMMYVWNYGDGSPADSSFNNNAYHTYTVAGNYVASVKIFDYCGNDTTITDTIFIDANAPVDPWVYFSAYPSPACPGDNISFSASSGFQSYTWNFGDGSPSLSTADNSYANHIYTATGNYTASVNFKNLCGNDTTLYYTVTVDNTIGFPSWMYLNNNPYEACPGDKVEFYTEWGYPSYIWNFGDGSPADSSADAYTAHNFAAAGSYTVSVKVTNNCGKDTTLYSTVTISNNLPVSYAYLYSYPDPVCPGDKVFFNTNEDMASYAWNFGDGTTSSDSYPNHSYASVGTYTVTLTMTNGCGNDTTLFDSVSVQNNVVPNPWDYDYGTPGDSTDSYCPGDSVIFFFGPSSGGTYLWEFGDGTSTTVTTPFNPEDNFVVDIAKHAYSAAGNYNAVLTYTNGCGNSFTDTIPVKIENNAPAGGEFWYDEENACAGGYTVFTAYGGSSYTWNFGDGSAAVTTTGSLTPVFHVYSNTGTYNVSVIITNGCGNKDTLTGPVYINSVCSSFTAQVTTVSPTCPGGKNGSATVTVTGGTSPFSYVWSNGQTGATASGLGAGTYTVTITDNTGVVVTASGTVTNPAGMTLNISTTNATCGTSDGSATVSVTGGTSPYTYLWTSGHTTATADSLASGMYNVTVKDAKGCEKNASVTISDAGAATISVVSVTHINCNGATTGAIDISVSGGTTPYTYEWSNGATTQDISNLSAGPYEIIVTSGNGCKAMQSITINQPAKLAVSLAVTNSDCGMANGSVTASVSGGTSPYTYIWSNGDVNPAVMGLPMGAYTVTVTDVNGCTKTAAATVSETGGPVVVIDSIVNPDCGATVGAIYVTVTGGATPYVYSWSDGATTEDHTAADTGSYTLTVTEAGGCQSMIMAAIEYQLPDRQEICLVTVDTVTGKNLVVWEKPTATNIASYNIYKESSQAGVYQKVGNVPYDSLSVYVDSVANPQVKSFRYKLSCVTACGDESLWSGQEHKTMHLTINLGLNSSINLIWSHYQGVNYGTYAIHRYTDTQGWEAIDSVAATDNSYTDLAPPVADELFYVVEAVFGDVCTATRAQNYNSSRSNKSQSIASPTAPDFINENSDLGYVSVYPNPNKGIFTLNMELKEKSDVTINLFDVQGRLISSEQTNVNGRLSKKMDISGHSTGVYHLQVITGSGIVNKKIVLN